MMGGHGSKNHAAVVRLMLRALSIMGYDVILERRTAIKLRNQLNPVIPKIKQAVCEKFGITMNQLMANRRQRKLARARQVGMWLAYECTLASMPAIGQAFGRDHTTVHHAVKIMPEIFAKDVSLKHAAEELRRRFYRPSKEARLTRNKICA